MIENRGKPNQCDVIHKGTSVRKKGMCSKTETSCLTGAFNIRHTSNNDLVSCKRCLQIMKKESLKNEH